MKKFDLNKTYCADCIETAETRIGEIFHIRWNRVGSGSVMTPVARYFVWRPNYVEGFNPHWRIDCFFRKHERSGNPEELARLLAARLQEIGACDLPVWISWHRSDELGGDSLGNLWEGN